MTLTTKMSGGLRIWITNQLAFWIRIRIIFNWTFGSRSVIQDLRIQGSGTEQNDNGSTTSDVDPDPDPHGSASFGCPISGVRIRIQEHGNLPKLTN
jgi:hypothetical protein